MNQQEWAASCLHKKTAMRIILAACITAMLCSGIAGAQGSASRGHCTDDPVKLAVVIY